jgi:hypothetical protein
MSVTLLKWSQRQRLNDKCALVLHTIAFAINPKQQRPGWPSHCAWPSQILIAALSNGMSVSSVKRCLGHMSRMGLISIHSFRLDGHSHNVYTVNNYRSVRWDPKAMSWPHFVRQEEAAFQSNERMPGEDKAAFVARVSSRLVPTVIPRRK